MIIHSKIKDYTLIVTDNAFSVAHFQAVKHQRRFYFIDKALFGLYADQFKQLIGNDFYLTIEALEDNKSYLKLADYYHALIDAGFKRQDAIVTYGGGILQDISGFIASTIYRGVPWIFVPTTLLAQADSCIGSKTSINFAESKNLIGTFYPPDLICVDGSFTRSLTARDFNSGLGEIIKFHLLSDPAGYDLLNKFLATQDLRLSPLFNTIISSTLAVKKSYFESDEFDTGRRNLLNYGHCFGHALEAATHFGVAHGEAVIIGMGFANRISLKRGMMAEGTYHEFERLLRRFYPAFDLRNVTVESIISHMKKDKKRTTSQLTMILARRVGQFDKCDDVTEHEIHAAMESLVKDYPVNNKQGFV